MFIKRYTDDLAYTLEMNEDEFKVMKMLYDKLIFNPEGVSNYFKVTDQDVEIINQMRIQLNGIKNSRLLFEENW
jgi:predicted nucleic acid-binding protein